MYMDENIMKPIIMYNCLLIKIFANKNIFKKIKSGQVVAMHACWLHDLMNRVCLFIITFQLYIMLGFMWIISLTVIGLTFKGSIEQRRDIFFDGNQIWETVL